MTQENFGTAPSVKNQRVISTILHGPYSFQPHFNLSAQKRRITHHWCSRLTNSKLPGADLAVEYTYGKYIKNLSAVILTLSKSGKRSDSKWQG